MGIVTEVRWVGYPLYHPLPILRSSLPGFQFISFWLEALNEGLTRNLDPALATLVAHLEGTTSGEAIATGESTRAEDTAQAKPGG